MTDGRLRMASNRGITGTGTETVDVLGGELLSQWFDGVMVTLAGDGVITLYGGADPMAGNATVNIASYAALFQFNNETPDAVIAEHLDKFTVYGQPAELGVNLDIVPFNGTSGAQLFLIPEPATCVLLGLGLVAVARRRRR